MNFKEYLNNNNLYLDGGMGTLLQAKGLKVGELPERWNITNPNAVIDIHRSYFDAGSNIVCTNTFGANSLKFTDNELEDIISSAILNANTARTQSTSKQEKFIALDIGPLGKLLKPLGDLNFEDAVSIFSKTIKIGVKYSPDLIIIETMNDSYETKAALLAAKENSDLPIIVTNAYSEDGKLMTGASPSAMVALLEGMGVTALGANCSLGPKQLKGIAEELLKYASVPVVIKPNAGIPKVVDGKTVYDIGPEDFALEVKELVEKGVKIVGGCCGTNPEYIKALVDATKDIPANTTTFKDISIISSYTHSVTFGNKPILIGERINPTGKKRFKQALIENDIGYILNEGINQQEKGVQVLDVNVGLPDIDEVSMLENTVFELQAVTDLPLQIDTANTFALEKAMRIYNGKPMINSVNGKIESMSAVFPLVKKYGGFVVALTLDENGIPETAEERFNIAQKILNTAKEYGIDKKDIIFDPLAMTISADNNSALVTLKSLRDIKEKLGCNTSLGVSNVSFGLPNRDAINSTFFALALENGLSAAIMNPYSADMMRTYYSFNALHSLDENCKEYIESINNFVSLPVDATTPQTIKTDEFSSELQKSIIKGLKEQTANITRELIKTKDPMDIINNEVIPALNIVGKGFEDKTVFLPQLLMSAEAAKSAFEIVKSTLVNSSKTSNENKDSFVIATVKGDIHDIGKNIVKLLLENYGFNVIDLGKDVSPETILEATKKHSAKIVGLSALMTTTLPAMEETINLLKDELPDCKIIVGGAVLNPEYAEKIGGDKYAKDAMEAVRYAKEILNI